MNTRTPVISMLIFPFAPIVVIFTALHLCGEIWYASYYMPGEDGGEVEPAVALFIIPMLLSVISLLLGGLTALGRWGLPRWLTGLARVPLAIIALLLSLVATLFFMGQPQAIFMHWEVALTWLAWLGSAGVFLVQQWDRLRNGGSV